MTSSAGGACGARAPTLKDSYDVVIIGGGSHGLATAYYLRERGITDVCVLEKGYIGSGAAGRNTTILRSNYKTPEGARFYDASVKLYEGLSRELNFNLLFSQCGHLTLAHSDRAMFVMANRAEVNRLQGIDSRLIGPDEVKRLAPGHVRRARLRPIRSWARSTTRPAASSATTPSSGAWPAAPTRAARRSTPTPRSSASSAPTAASTRCAPTAARSAPGRWSTAPRAGARCCATWPASGCRSPPTSCRRA